MPGREFSNQYSDLAQWQEGRCHLCPGIVIPGVTFTIQIPEDMCIKCLISIAKQIASMWKDNVSLEKKQQILKW
jgi:hypothetical protein